VAKILALPCGKPPREATHWTGRMVAKAAGVSLRAVQRIWQANRLQPHRVRTFKTSNDPAFAEKAEDVVGLYMNPPVHAVVVSIDEKSQIQALDRTPPGLPMKPGKCGTMTHDYKRNGTTTLFAALNILDGTVVGRCMPSHTHKEFIKFLNAVEARGPARQNHPCHRRQLRHPQASQEPAPAKAGVKQWLADGLPRRVADIALVGGPGSASAVKTTFLPNSLRNSKSGCRFERVRINQLEYFLVLREQRRVGFGGVILSQIAQRVCVGSPALSQCGSGGRC
jgi:hypothetical protein